MTRIGKCRDEIAKQVSGMPKELHEVGQYAVRLLTLLDLAEQHGGRLVPELADAVDGDALTFAESEAGLILLSRDETAVEWDKRENGCRERWVSPATADNVHTQ